MKVIALRFSIPFVADESAASFLNCAPVRYTAILIVLCFAGIMAHVEYWATYQAMVKKIGEPPEWLDAMMVIQWMASFTAQLIVCVVCAAAAHCMAVIFDGNGRFRDVLMVWGFGYLPAVFVALYFLNILNDASEEFVAAALDRNSNIVSIPGMMNVKVLAIFAQCLCAVWGIFIIRIIHRISFARSILSLVLPVVFFLMLKMAVMRLQQ